MACFAPLRGWRSRQVNENGKRPIVFNRKDGFTDLEEIIPCGQCIGCRIDRSKQWAIRCVHEASQYNDNCFITLTFSDEHLPADGSLNVKYWQRFMYRLRKKHGEGIRFFHCGEYGSKLGRPHYHACLFNFDFKDKKIWKKSGDGSSILYRSAELERLWPYGYATVGNVTFESAAYVARYILKKITGEKAPDHYQGKKPEYTTMSRRPGLGKGWFDLYQADLYPSDFVVHDGKKLRIPRFYDEQYEAQNPNEMAKIKSRRKEMAKQHAANNTLQRLSIREVCQEKKIKLLKREVEL